MDYLGAFFRPYPRRRVASRRSRLFHVGLGLSPAEQIRAVVAIILDQQ